MRARARRVFLCVATYPRDILRSFERDRRRHISPGVAFLWLGLTGFGAYGFADADHSRSKLANAQQTFVSSSYNGCVQNNAARGAILDLGQLVALLRGTTASNAQVKGATDDLMSMSRHGSKDPMLARALKDIGVVLGGSSTGKPDPKSLQKAKALQAVEDDFIAKAAKIVKPRPCKRIYDVEKVPQ